MEEKNSVDSTTISAVYTAFVNRAELLPSHRKQLQKARGFTDETINKAMFKSAHPGNEQVVLGLRKTFSLEDLKKCGLLNEANNPSPKILKDNILIPYLDWGVSDTAPPIVGLRPHKDFFHGSSIQPYMAGKPQSFVILAESEFKALAAAQWGFGAVGIPGISSHAKNNFPKLVELLKASGVSVVCVIFDTEIKSDPKLPNYKADFWVRWETQYYAYLMAEKLADEGFDTSITVLPLAWAKNGKIDLDGALGMGKTRDDMLTVLNTRLDPKTYLKSLPDEPQAIVFRKYIKSRMNLPVTENFNRYWVRHDKKEGEVSEPVAVTNFVFEIENNYISPDGNCRREVTMVNEFNERSPKQLFEGEHLGHYVAFKKHCLSYGNFLFSGTQRDLDLIVRYEMAKDKGRKVYQPDHTGWIKSAELYLFQNCALSEDGERLSMAEDGVIWRGMTGWQPIVLQQQTSEEHTGGMPILAPDDIDPAVLIDLMEQNFSGFQGIRLAVAWSLATLFSHYLCNVYPTSFPILFICGQAQGGKSTLCKWIHAMAGLHFDGFSYWTSTTVGMERSLSYYSSLPVWIDEFRNSTDNRAREKEGFFRSAYDRQASLKGLRSTFGTRGSTVRGCIMLSGQDTPQDEAFQQRCVTIRLKKAYRNSSQYEKLNSMLYQMSGVIPVVVRRYKERAGRVIEAVKMIREYFVKQGMDDRTAITYSIVLGVYDGIIKENDKKFLNFCANHAKEAFSQKQEERATQEFLTGLQDMKVRNELDNCVRTMDDGMLAIHFSLAFGIWKEKTVRRREDFQFKKNALLEMFEEEDCFVAKNKNVRVGEQVVRCLVLDPEKDETVKSLYEASIRRGV